jgi:hypothetical protein
MVPKPIRIAWYGRSARLPALLRPDLRLFEPGLARFDSEFRGLAEGQVWQRRLRLRRLYGQERIEKVCYMHRNPVVRGLVLEPLQWGAAPPLRLRRTRSGAGLRTPKGRASHPRNLLIAAASQPTRERATVGQPHSRWC